LEGWDEVGLGDLRTDGLLQISELVRNHIANPPGLVLCTLAECRHHQLFDIFGLQEARNGDASFDCQKPDRILFILSQVDEHRDQVGLEVLDLDHLGELAQLAGGSTSNHGSIILTQVAELASQIGCKQKVDLKRDLKKGSIGILINQLTSQTTKSNFEGIH
jgi:hypothetical protein